MLDVGGSWNMYLDLESAGTSSAANLDLRTDSARRHGCVGSRWDEGWCCALEAAMQIGDYHSSQAVALIRTCPRSGSYTSSSQPASAPSYVLVEGRPVA